MFYTLLKKSLKLIDDKINLILIIVLLLLIIVNINIDTREKLVNTFKVDTPTIGEGTADAMNSLIMETTYKMIDVIKHSTGNAMKNLLLSSVGKGEVSESLQESPVLTTIKASMNEGSTDLEFDPDSDSDS